MADTWVANAQAVTYAANKGLLDVFNANTSDRFIRIYRAHLFNNQTSAITGVLNLLNLYQTSAAASGTSVTPVAMATANTALNAGTTAGHNRTLTTGSLLRQMANSGDEPTVATLDWDSLQCTLPGSILWDTGYGDSTIQPFTCAASENRGFAIYSLTQTVGQCDTEILFTNSAS